jgi:hypothetical protein
MTLYWLKAAASNEMNLHSSCIQVKASVCPTRGSTNAEADFLEAAPIAG